MAKSLSAARVIGTVGTPGKAAAARALGYDEILTIDDFPAGFDGRPVDVIVDPVGGPLRTASLEALGLLGRLLVVGHAAEVSEESVAGNDLWFTNRAVLGFNVGAFLQAAPAAAAASAGAALRLIARGDLHLPVEVMPLAGAALAHRRLEERSVAGRLVLVAR